MRVYNSFLVRCWVSGGDVDEADQLYDVEHLQSGGHVRSRSLERVKDLIGDACLPDTGEGGRRGAADARVSESRGER